MERLMEFSEKLQYHKNELGFYIPGKNWKSLLEMLKLITAIEIN